MSFIIRNYYKIRYYYKIKLFSHKHDCSFYDLVALKGIERERENDVIIS